jgi:hypothetical protein
MSCGEASLPDSISAFLRAGQFLGSSPKAVFRSSSANSVWFVETEIGVQFVIKSFDGDEHSRLHYVAESQFLLANAESEFVPELLAKSDQDSWFVMPFYEHVESADFDLNAVLKIIDERFAELNVPFFVHDDLPGILAWGKTNTEISSPVQRIILEVMRETSWFNFACLQVSENWLVGDIVHCDVKLANIQITLAGPVFLDWENVSRGPKNWDIAGLVQGIVVEILQTGPKAAWARSQLPATLDYLSECDDMTLRSVALRTVQSAFEMSKDDRLFTSSAANLLQCADMIATRSIGDLAEGLSNA